MRKSKKLLSILLTLCMLLSAVPMMTFTASAANTIDGTDITWEVVDNVLTISGTGEIPSFGSGESPWYNRNLGHVTKIIIGEGITGIGKYAFNSICDYYKAKGDFMKSAHPIEVVQLPSTIKKIGDSSFSYAKITKLVISAKTDKSLVFKSDAFLNSYYPDSIEFDNGTGTGDNFIIENNILYTKDKKEIVFIPFGFVDYFTPSSEVEKIANSKKINLEGFLDTIDLTQCSNIDSDLTVDVISFKDGTSSSQYYLGELLEASVTSKSGKSTDDLYYCWVRLDENKIEYGNEHYNYISGFDNSDLLESNEIMFSKDARWAATKGAEIIRDGSCDFALVICRKDSDGNCNIVGKKIFSVSTDSPYTATDSLKRCVDGNTVTMFKGETLSIQQLLARCGVSHTTCTGTTIANVATTGTDYLGVNGYDVTANNVGQNIPVTFDFSSKNCTYHAADTQISTTGNTLTINVIDPVATKSDCGGFAITNPVSGYDYTIKNQKGTLSDGKIKFDNLTSDTDYTLKLSLTGKYGSDAAQVTTQITTGALDHTFATDWSYDSTNHWHAATCVHSTEKSDVAAHTGMDDGICDVCGYKSGNVYDVTCAECENGSVSVGDTTSYDEGDTVIVTATPATGYMLDEITVYKTGTPATTVSVSNNQFTMPTYAVTVSATFKEKTEIKTEKTVTNGDKVSFPDETNKALEDFIAGEKSSLTKNTDYDFSVEPETPTDTAKTAVEQLAKAGAYATANVTRTATFYDATFTKTEDGGTAENIIDTGDNVIPFTIEYSMEGKCELGVYRYHTDKDKNSTAEELKLVTSATDDNYGKDGTYCISGSGKNTKITIYASKFSDYVLASTAIPTDVGGTVYAASLTLKDNIDVNFIMKDLGTDGKGTGFDASKLSFTVDGGADLADSTTNKSFKVVGGVASGMSVSVTPENIGTPLHIVVKYNNITVKDFTYSVKDYCDAVFNTAGYGESSKLGQLCVAVLNYGKYAEDYKNKNTASTLNDGYAIDFTKVKVETVDDSSTTAENAAASLTLGTTISINFYVTDTVTEKQVTIFNDNDEQVEAKYITVAKSDKEGYSTKITVNDIYAEHLSNAYTLKVDNKKIIAYGVYNYCADVVAQETNETYTETLQTLCKAIYNYGEKAAAYAA